MSRELGQCFQFPGIGGHCKQVYCVVRGKDLDHTLFIGLSYREGGIGYSIVAEMRLGHFVRARVPKAERTIRT